MMELTRMEEELIHIIRNDAQASRPVQVEITGEGKIKSLKYRLKLPPHGLISIREYVNYAFQFPGQLTVMSKFCRQRRQDSPTIDVDVDERDLERFDKPAPTPDDFD